MRNSLEARIAKLEGANIPQTYGPRLGRQLAELGGYVGDKLEAMAKFFSGQPMRTHEQAVDAVKAAKP